MLGHCILCRRQRLGNNGGGGGVVEIYFSHYFFFAQLSFSATARLNTKASGVLSLESRQK